MQRTVNFTRVHYAGIGTDENGKRCLIENTVDVPEIDLKKVSKILTKMVGVVDVIDVKKYAQLYVMPDSEFLQFAEPVGDPKEIIDEE